MLQDDRTNAQAMAGLFDIGGYMRDEFAKNPPPAMEQAKPMSLMDKMDERYGKLSNRLSLFGHLIGGGDRSTFGDADLLAEQELLKKQRAMQAQMEMANPYFAAMQDDDPTNDAQAIFAMQQMGVGDKAMGMMFPGMAPSEDTDIMRTTKAYVDSYNEQNPGDPISFHQGYDIVKNYDAGRRGEQAGAVETAKSNVQQYTTSRDAYITAVEQDAVLGDRIANIDKGLAMLENGEVDTGPVVGFLAETFGMGSQELGALQQMGLEEAIDALQAFKGPTTDFEFTKAELKSFAQIFRGENLNIGTLKQAKRSLEKVRKRNMLSGQSHLEAVKQYGSNEQFTRLGSVFAQPEHWTQGQQGGAQSPAGNGSGAWDGKRIDFNGMNPDEFTAIYDSMPSGTVYVGPDGKRRVRK